MASSLRRMSTSRSTLSHVERTAREPRQNALYQVVLSRIEQVNSKIRLLRLEIPDRGQIKFLPGQWLDVHIPGLSKPGGFTITSTPREALPLPSRPIPQKPLITIQDPSVQLRPTRQAPQRPSQIFASREDTRASEGSGNGYLELAIQSSLQNPPAAWLWRPENEILGEKLLVRVGGNFVWPPPGVDAKEIRKVILVAGGVGINPLISILSHLETESRITPGSIKVLYTIRPLTGKLGDVLFYDRIKRLIPANPSSKRTLDLYLTDSPSSSAGVKGVVREFGLDGDETGTEAFSMHHRRIIHEDLITALGPIEQRRGAVAYVCGPARMTDEFVDVLRGAEGMSEESVLCEKWW